MVVLLYFIVSCLVLLVILYIFGYIFGILEPIKDKVPEIKKTSTSLNFCAGELQKYFHTKDLLVEKYLNTFRIDDNKIYVHTINLKHFHEAIINNDINRINKLNEFFLESIHHILTVNKIDKTQIIFKTKI